MKKKINIFLIICFMFYNCKSQNIASYVSKGFEINLRYENDFSKDNIKDILLILNSVKENELLINNKDSISKRKLLIILGGKTNKYSKIIEKDDIIPCKECAGKCDNLYSDLSFSNEILSYTTCNYPFESTSYTVSTYKLRLKENKNFNLIGYSEKYYENAEDENPIYITLKNSDFICKNFDYYNFNFAQNSWINQIVISQENIVRLNNIAFELYKKGNYNLSSILLQKILQKFPNRIVAYLNLADSYWAIGNQQLAKENYKKYIELMQSQKKDLTKIPKQVSERIK